ncbi:RecQ family ATP-dependent DNA helicase [Terrilactibacillus laevilacticus]|uniref:ATP-dependent DNA helicase RecQ n=1 Tax=Terrilactibacillus laevilacticus TaxID=1380157 RepID=A0ABW5PS65_9BACI|nr:ATP-dependent DNA helicase RecQ [Terrilactibacillus laevilacticus]
MLETILKEKFGYSSFRQGQKEIIDSIIHRRDVFAVLPTGSGKSICYLLPGYVMEGLVIIVTPLLSLMEDQCEQLRAHGEKRVKALNSFLTYQEKERILGQLRDLKYLFISPEMLQNKKLLNQLTKIKIALFVVDEAHCISEWGHEFRTDYLKLASIRHTLGTAPCLALTATANDHVKRDIIKQLDMEQCDQYIYPIDRKNISIVVKKCETIDEKIEEAISIIKTVHLPGILYCGSRDWTEQLTSIIQIRTNYRVAYYHGGMTTEDRILIQRQFIDGELDLIVCTNAFGMGINKSNVRLVMHFHYPKHINSYVQEIGRAGRDGKQSLAVLLYCPLDDQIPKHLIDQSYPDDDVLARIFSRIKYENVKLHSDQLLVIMQEEGASETAAQFLHYQLRQFANKDLDIEKVQKMIKSTIQERKQHKWRELNEMKRWIETKRCRREAYLELYNEQVIEKREPCCDHCGLNWDIFRKGKREKRSFDKMDTWEERLQKLLNNN